jgi:hypothetical protein
MTRDCGNMRHISGLGNGSDLFALAVNPVAVWVAPFQGRPKSLFSGISSKDFRPLANRLAARWGTQSAITPRELILRDSTWLKEVNGRNTYSERGFGGMELRLLKTDGERDRFRANMLEVRAARGARFRETPRSRVSEIQLTFARLYGLFHEARPDDMLGGFSIHCLNEFSQSFPVPNLSHLVPSGVFEAGQLWASSHEAAQSLRKGSLVLLGLFQAQALLIYPLIIPRDISTLYRVFKRVGPPFELPFAETVTGDKVYMQAMMLEGDDLRRQVDLVSCDGFETRDGHAVVRFKAPNTDALRETFRRHRAADGPEAQANAPRTNVPTSSERVPAGLARRSEARGADAGKLSLPRINDAATDARPNDPEQDSRFRGWSWCEYANEPRCPFQPECELQCRGKGFVSESEDKHPGLYRGRLNS